MNNLAILLRRRASGFNIPVQLFGAAEPGIYHIPRPATCFTDLAGTTQAGPGGAVALRLDESRGLVLGPELALTDTIIAGPIVNPASPSTVNYTVSTSLIVGRFYEFRATVSNYSGTGSIGFPSGTVDATKNIDASASRLSGNGEIKVVGVAATETVRLFTREQNTCTFTNISIRELLGNHITQPTLANRRILGRMPKRGRVNALLNTDTLATQTRTVAAVQQTLSFRGTGTVTLSGASTAGPLVGTGADDIVSLTFTPTAGSLTLTVSGTVEVAMLEPGAVRTNYQRVGSTQFDVTEPGQRDCWYLYSGGTADPRWDVSPTITPGTDKVQVIAGVRKLSDDTAVFVSNGNNNAASNSFEFFSTRAGTSYSWRTNGDIAGFAQSDNLDSASLSAPRSNIVFGSAALNTGNKILRVSGDFERTSVATNLSTANFLTNSIIFGARNTGTPSSFFNGLDFGHIIRFGPNLDEATLQRAERAIAQNTSGVYL